MASKIIRTETHALSTTPEFREDVLRTVLFYRRIVKLLATVAMTHWPELGPLRSQERQMALEAKFHATKARPIVRYPKLGETLGKMPSYLRRAALNAALGAVSSFLSNYSNFVEGNAAGKKLGTKRELGARSPRLGFSNVFPPLYGGNMILVGVKNPLPRRAVNWPDFVGPLPEKKKPKNLKKAAQGDAAAAVVPKIDPLATPYGTVRIKVLEADGQWRFSSTIKIHGKAKRLSPDGALDLAPTLMLRGAKVWLACPSEVKRVLFIPPKSIDRVLAVDVGINVGATLVVVDSTGTVIARKSLTCGRHNDQRDALGLLIASKQRDSGGTRKGEPFCSGLHRRIAGISLDAARYLASEIAAFAVKHNAKAFVIEDLKGWRPKGPNRNQRKRFHRFQHRMLVKHLGFKAQELGMRMLEVYARGTSRYAYDGSGIVIRSTKNTQLATFTSGKQYNADLNGASNIAARGLAMLFGIKSAAELLEEAEAKKTKAETGQSSGPAVRVPLVLADIWAHAKVQSLKVKTTLQAQHCAGPLTAAAGVEG